LCFLNGNNLTQVDNFVYLGEIISIHENAEADVVCRIDAARGIFHMLRQLWNSKEICKQTKSRVYETLVLSVLLYNTETWTLKASLAKRLKTFEMACLRKIEGVTRRDSIKNTEIQGRLGWTQDLISRIQQRRLHYFGHVVRMKNDRYHIS